MPNPIHVFTDAAFRQTGKTGEAGIACLFYKDDSLLGGWFGRTDASCVQEAEAKAIELALNHVPSNSENIVIYNDNDPVINGLKGTGSIPEGAYGTVYYLKGLIRKTRNRVLCHQIERSSNKAADAISSYALDFLKAGEVKELPV